ncbi:ER lumen protein-retaining receptor B [Porphyridium purpureum]|uniref:ER lumen protein-retaining receptor B n=1 Tax=Porphyridium purpureum TaxID=35688 RepID=A0A5J4YXQ3_PORPP|nr:ER lumen protein-retaining receptor B [Porphyridium purpureum]|eukprot:POR5105..scf209_3
MNLFRLGGDLLHVFSIFVLTLKIKTSKNVAGISLRTQQLYLLVFCTRYLDLLFTNPFRSGLTMYNTVFKILFIASSAYIVYLMRKKYKQTYSVKDDTFRVEFLIVPACLAGTLFHYRNTFFEIVWAFSIYMESVAIIPQLYLLQKTGEVENLTSHYIACLGGYRALYLLNWVWRFFTEPRYRHWIEWIAGTIQTALYADFFYYYFLNKTKGQKLKLPP